MKLQCFATIYEPKAKAKVQSETWHVEHNERRTRQDLSGLTPEAFAEHAIDTMRAENL